MNNLIEEIHNSFYTSAQSNLQVFEKELQSKSKQVQSHQKPEPSHEAMVSQLQELGFNNSKTVKTGTQTFNDKKVEFKKNNQAHIMFKELSTMNLQKRNIISFSQLKKIANKYGLILCNSEDYIGDIPKEQTQHLINFKPYKSAVCKYPINIDSSDSIVNGPQNAVYASYSKSPNRRVGKYDKNILIMATPDLIDLSKKDIVDFIAVNQLKKPSVASTIASVKETRRINALKNDPIALHPYVFFVQGAAQIFFEIITAWGPEAELLEFQNSSNN